MTIGKDRNKDRFENWQLCGVWKLPFCGHRTINLTQNWVSFANPCINHERNVVGDAGTCPPHFFRRWGHNMPCPPHFFLFTFCISSGFKNKSDACHVLCEELFMLNGRPYIVKLMLKQSLVWYHWFCYFMNFSFDKITFSIFQVSRDRERCLTAFVRHFTLCGMLLERLFSCKSKSITAAHVRGHSRPTAVILSVQKCNWLCCNVVTYSETDSV